jgi:hypothetical protein
MALTVVSHVGPYEVVAAIGKGGMSACGHAEPRTWKSEATRRRQFALGVGPQRR